MAECHPVGFQWVMEAKERGARIIHVDPRFTRTSAMADVHVPIRAGTDIVRVPNRGRRSGVCLVANLFGENRSLESVLGEQDCAGEPGDPRANHSDTWLH